MQSYDQTSYQTDCFIYGEELRKRLALATFLLRKVARVTGLEPATSGVTGRHSNQLSYTRASFSVLRLCHLAVFRLRPRAFRFGGDRRFRLV